MSTLYRLINIGTFPNDTEGDSLRTAFTKINENFSDVEAALSVLGFEGVDEYILRDGSVAFIANVDLGNNRIVNLENPINQTDAANKQYVDTQAQSLINQLELRNLSDIDSSTLDDGAVIVYDKGTDKFLTQTLLEKQFINGGHF